MPFAIVSGMITGLVEMLRNRAHVWLHRRTVVPDSGVGRVEASLETRANGAADGLAGEVVDEMSALFGESVEIGRQTKFGAVDTGGVETLLISEKDDDVGALCRHRFGFHSASKRTQA